jgi:hypothetical protein
MDFNGTEREAFDQLVKDFKKEYEHKEDLMKREKGGSGKNVSGFKNSGRSSCASS